MRTIRARYVDLPEGQVHLREAEGEGPPIVFFHQTASSAGSYLPLMRALALPNRLIAIDTPGFGGSYDPVGRPALADYVATMLATLDVLGVPQAHFFGHHTGASLALAIAADAPGRALSIMLAGPVLMSEAEREQFAQSYDEPIAPRRDGGHLLTNWNYAAGYNPDCDVALLHDEVVAMLRAWRGRGQAYGAVARHDAWAAARRVTQPVLLLSSPDDFSYAEFDRAKLAFPGAEVAITGGGNFQPAADPEGVARAIRGFLLFRRAEA